MKPRFSIRDLLWLTALLAVALAWWVDHRRITTNALIDAAVSKDSTMVRLRWEISSWEFARSVQTDNGTKSAFDPRIAELEQRIKDRRDELLREISK